MGIRLRVRWEGDHEAYHSLARVNRELCRALGEKGTERISLIGVMSQAQRRRAGYVDVHVSHRWPPCWQRPHCGTWIVIQPWEYGSLPQSWLDPINTLVDELWVYTSYLRACAIRSGIKPDKVHVVPLGVDPARFHPRVSPLPLAELARYNFLFVGGTIWRKGADILLDTYVDTFGPLDDVCLVVKDFGTQSFYHDQGIGPQIRAARDNPTSPRIIYLSGDMAEDAMPALYRSCQALIAPYRGEGYGLPIAEAMACGLPVVVPHYGACLDYTDDATAIRLAASVEFGQGARNAELETAARPYWCEVSRPHLASAMRSLVDGTLDGAAIGDRASMRMRARHTWDDAAACVRQRLSYITPARRPKRPAAPTVCLAMIVRNESAVIDRALASVKEHIGAWCIADTGSTDDTCGRIQAMLSGIPGRLDHDAWTGDFAANRNLVFERALASGCDYILSLDADEVLQVTDLHWRKDLCDDGYMLIHHDGAISWGALRLVRADPAWSWHDPFHEYLDREPEPQIALLEGACLSTPQDGARSQDPAKLEKDLETLQRAVAADTQSTRLRFYLGMAYQNTGHVDEAIAVFMDRVAMGGGHTAEIFHSLYRIAHLYVQRGDNHAVPGAFLRAYAAGPYYAEPLYWLGRYFLAFGKYDAALPFLELAGEKRKPPPVLFVEDDIYEYAAKMYTALCCMCLGRQQDADAILSTLEEQGKLPPGALDSAEEELIAILPHEEAS